MEVIQEQSDHTEEEEEEDNESIVSDGKFGFINEC